MVSTFQKVLWCLLLDRLHWCWELFCEHKVLFCVEQNSNNLILEHPKSKKLSFCLEICLYLKSDVAFFQRKKKAQKRLKNDGISRKYK